MADPLIVHWPAGIADPGDGAPPVRATPSTSPPPSSTLCGIDPPQALRGVPQSPLEGVSLAAVLRDGDHPEVHTVQYFEMFGCRALYRDGYKAVTFQPIQVDEPRPDDEHWELYDVRIDPSECHDLAAEHADLLAEMVEEWWRQAEAHRVLPVDNRPFSEFTLARPRSTPTLDRVVLRPSPAMVPEVDAPDLRNRTHSIVATFDVGAEGATGVLASQGSGLSGWVLYCDGDSVTWHLNVATRRHTTVTGPAALGAGRHTVELYYTKIAELQGEAALLVDGNQVASGDVGFTIATRVSMTGAGLFIGRGDAYPVCDRPAAGATFTGSIDTVVFSVEGAAHVDPDEVETAIAVQ